MEVLDINIFLSLKTNNEVQELDSKTIDSLYSLFGNIDKTRRNKKFNKKTNVNILKNQKIQNKKEIISNKVNLILNKMSESNIDSLIIEFVENINQVDDDNYDEIQKTFYLKIISEINFIKIYLQFLKVISYLYQKVQNFNISFFYSLVESKFKLDYTDYDIDPESKISFIKDMDGETKRLNNLIIINNLVEQKMMSSNIFNECDKHILNQSVFIPDIYHWFSFKNRSLNDEEVSKIKKLLKKADITSRETVLLENLINPKSTVLHNSTNTNTNTNNNTNSNPNPDINPNTNPNPNPNSNHNYTTITSTNKPVSTTTTFSTTTTKLINTDTLQLECENIIEEYSLYKSIEDVTYFIETRCLDAINKNKFCEYLIDKYFSLSKETSNDLLELMKQLIKIQTLFKSNLSRGLLLINTNWKEKSCVYNKPAERMKLLLSNLKASGITKGIEFLMDQYKVV